MDTLTLTPEQTLADIEAALAAGQRNRAIDLAVAAMGRGITPTLVLSLVAEGMEQDGLIADSLALFNRAQFEAPDDLAAKLAFARALSRHGADAEAVAPLEAVLAREPGHFEALMLRGKVATALGDLRGAGAAYEQAWAAKPDHGEPLAELALLAARRGDMANARARGLHALALSPGASRAAVAVARADLSEGKAGDARARLERAMAHPKLTEAADRADVLTYLGDALDALDLPAEAFTAWREREAVLRPSRAKAIADGAGERHIILARRLAAWFGGIPGGAWHAAPGASDDGHVAGHAFVLSFPRSGTTLLEQVLAAHPGVVARDESEALATAADHLIRDDAGLAALARLTTDEAEAARAAYWKQMRREIGEDLAGKVLIDKNPLNSMRLPIIAKLFPGARIIFAERDPRDVVLSGYRRLYYSQMLEFHTLDGAARFYDAVMRVTDIYRARLTLEAHTVRHETLVTDFEGEARRVLAFLGLEWTPAVLDFARGPVISVTPSAAQVAQGLNTDSVGQWRRYEDALAPVLPILEPWAVELGYEPAPLSPTSAAPNDRDAQFVSAVPELTAALWAVEADLKAGRLPAAMAKSEDALARGLADPLFHRLRGVRAQQQGRLDLAIADFEAVLAQAGEDAPVLNALGLCLARAGRAAEGLARLDRAIALNGRAAPFHFNRGWALEAAGDLQAARRAYETALGIDPKHAQAQANLAMLAARAADWPQTRALAARALELDPASPAAATALARAEAAFGDTVAARTRLQSVVAGQRADPHERAVALSALGDVLDQSGEPDAAFAAYDQGARILRGLYAPRFTGTEATSALAARLDESLAGMDKAKWRRGAPTPDATGPKKHIFLLGFPRSGTTMLGQALAGHPDVLTLDERSTLRDAAQTYLFPPHGLARLAAAGAEDLAPHRAAYWARVREGGAEPRGRVFIDKLPMNTLGLPLILRLFPNAKVLFLRRDPRDVVLSCLRRQFVIDATTIELLGLESAAGLYDRIMRLMETSRGVLDLDLREQSYETLVEAFEPQMREICAFIGLSYNPAMANFAGRADRVATPSAAQIAQGLNSEGVGVWRRYQAPLAPVMNQLAPWIARFGYDTN
jgi:tetratricopeptide (TPR) repeat protein